jgi:NRPS condensation-like uncharacterized protein
MASAPVNTTQLNALDELYLHLDREEDPWSVQLEVQFAGPVDAARLGDAIRQAALRHPMARARLGAARATDVRYRWEIFDDLDDDHLEVGRDDDLSSLRSSVFSQTPTLDRPGPFTVTLAPQESGDSIMLNLHHAAGDGISAVRLMTSIARAYAGEEDPLPGVDPLAVRDVTAMTKADSLSTRAKRGRHFLRRGLGTPERIVQEGAGDRPGYGFELLELDLAGIRDRRRPGVTVNDLLLAALAVTVREWNEERGRGGGLLSLTMPVNLRPAEWRSDVVGNFASYVAVRLAPEDQDGLEATAGAVADWTRRIKEEQIAGLMVQVVDLPTALPTGIKQRLPRLIPVTGDRLVDTAVLSNLGRLDKLPDLDGAGSARAVWFSPPGRMPLGVSVGVASLDDRLFMTLRYRHALLDRPAAREFVDRLRRTVEA